VGITGSNGKTTTKEMMVSVLATKGRTYGNPGNLNSEIGLPLSVMEIRRDHEYAVLEMGMNHSGEMAFLAEVARPNMGIITNIGTAHIGILGSRQAIAEEKKQIFLKFDENSQAVLPLEDEFREFLAEGLPGRVDYFSSRAPELSAVEDLGLDGLRFRWRGETIHLALPGLVNLRNALAVIKAAELLGVPLESIKEGLARVKASFGRGEIIALEDGGRILQDCYNANPDSMGEFLRYAGALVTPGRKLLVVGSMKELGRETQKAHEDLGRLAAEQDWAGVFFLGEEARTSWEVFRSCSPGVPAFWSDDFDQLYAELAEFRQRGDLLFVKGSRAGALERISQRMLENGGSADVL